MNRSCMATKSLYPFALSCVPWLFSPQVCRRHASVHSSIQRVDPCVCIKHLTTAKFRSRNSYSYVDLHARGISSRFHHDGRVRQTGRGWAEFIISHSLPQTHEFTQCQNLMHWLHLNKNDIILRCHHFPQTDIDYFSAGLLSDHN